MRETSMLEDSQHTLCTANRVFESRRIRAFGRQPILDADDDTARGERELARDRIVDRDASGNMAELPACREALTISAFPNKRSMKMRCQAAQPAAT
jgi:hypothetical protein